MHWKTALLHCATVILCSACASSPEKASSPSLPTAFEQQSTAQPAWPASNWHTGFASSELDRLITLAQQGNLDLSAAEARIRQADARARAAGASILPTLDGQGKVDRLGGRSNRTTANETDWSALLSASYEIDFWGKNRATLRSAQLATLASRAESATVALTIQTGIANGYFTVLSLRQREDLARANLAAANDVLQVIDARFKAGFTTAVELAAQKAAVANATLAIAPLEQQEFEARSALALLVGRVPEGFLIEARELDPLHEPAVAPGLPADLLTRRPDVFAAEANLLAAHADLVAARAALFPTIALTAGGGLQNPALQAAVITLEGTGATWSIGASVLQSIFDGGRNRAVRDEAEAKQQELLATYSAAILNALLDVETALSAIHHLDLRRAAQDENLLQSQRAFDAAKIRYRAGSGDYLTVLDAQRTLSAAREQFSLYKLERFQALVGLCKALGGGWQQPAMNPQGG